MYINISIHDYLRCLMGLHGKDTPWTLDPRIEIPGDDDKTGVQRGIGNQVSVEFNLLYRFHSPLSTRDRLWSEALFKRWLSGLVKAGKITEKQIEDGDIPVSLIKSFIDMRQTSLEVKEKETYAKKALKHLPKGLEQMTKEDASGKQTSYFKWKRDPKTGKFDDAQLVAEMTQVIEDPICMRFSCSRKISPPLLMVARSYRPIRSAERAEDIQIY